MGQPYVVRWGILATGYISTLFGQDLLLDPVNRGVKDVKHEIVAAAASNSAERARAYLDGIKAPATAAAYGSYKELVKDPNVDIIYVATPHSHHFQSAMLCLTAGKHVLLEKAFTVNAAQAKILVELARKKGLFLMEAVWTRFAPLSVEIRKLVADGKIGKVHRVIADFSFNFDLERTHGTKDRMVNLDLAGGVMLDMGIYPLIWIFQILYHLQPASTQQQPLATGIMSKYAPTGADESTSMLLSFPNINAQGIGLCNFRVASNPDTFNSAGPSVRIQGKLGEIQVFPPTPRPEQYKVIYAADGKGSSTVEDHHVKIPEGRGMYWEADECARCIRDGLKESSIMPLNETLAIMEVLDSIRAQNNLRYPEEIESTLFTSENT